MFYTYTQPVPDAQPYNGTLEARPVSVTTSRLHYTPFFDNSMLADCPARHKDIASRRALYTCVLRSMKTLAEGGILPPPAPRGVPPGR